MPLTISRRLFASRSSCDGLTRLPKPKGVLFRMYESAHQTRNVVKVKASTLIWRCSRVSLGFAKAKMKTSESIQAWSRSKGDRGEGSGSGLEGCRSLGGREGLLRFSGGGALPLEGLERRAVVAKDRRSIMDMVCGADGGQIRGRETRCTS